MSATELIIVDEQMTTTDDELPIATAPPARLPGPAKRPAAWKMALLTWLVIPRLTRILYRWLYA